MTKERILIVDGESGILELVRDNFPRRLYRVKGVLSYGKALSEAVKYSPNLILIDLMAPRESGLNVCRELKNSPKTEHIPIIILAAKEDDSDIASKIRLEVDGWLARPISPHALQAAVEEILQTKSAQADESYMLSISGLVINPLNREVMLNGAELKLTPIEFAILYLLARTPGQALTRDQITRSVKGRGLHETDRSLDVQMVQLRRKLGDAAQLIETVRGMGYRFRRSPEARKIALTR